MKKFEKIIFVRIIPILLMFTFFVLPTIISMATADFNLGAEAKKITANENSNFAKEARGIASGIKGAVLSVGKVIATIMLIIMGIKYVMSAPEGRAEYRKMAIPYVVGVVLIYGEQTIVDDIYHGNYENTVKTHVTAVGDAILSVSKIICVIMLIVIGIKYVMSAPEGRAEYRKTMIPYVVGVILIYSVSTIAEGGSTIISDIQSTTYNNIVSNRVDKVRETIQTVGETIAVIMLIVIGIKYMTSAPEGKAEYRKIMIPYIIGAILIYTASSLAGELGSSNFSVAKDVTNDVLPILRYVGTGIAIIMLIVLGIKYMSTAPEGKAEVQKTMVPYVIGAVVLFAAGTFVGIIQNFANGIRPSLPG